MHIIRSRVMGFCSGVQQAVRAVNDAVILGREEGRKVYTIGPLIHNEAFLERLRAEDGVTVIENPDSVEPGIAVIRAHGIPEAERERFLERGFTLIDGTCQRVIASQRTVGKAAAAGRQIVIAGNPEHGEVKALLGAAGEYDDIHVMHESSSIPPGIDCSRSILLLAQTTYSRELYEAITDKLLAACTRDGGELEVIDSICPSTLNRQQALQGLIEKVDAVLIVGGRGSANTRRLFEIASASGKPSWLVTGKEDVTSAMQQYGTLGITAGASTPEWLVDEVIGVLSGRDL